jgi:sigma-B regulation protein RsbQ
MLRSHHNSCDNWMLMTVQHRNNVRVRGEGPATLIFSHGFGCDQTMWRFVAPSFENRFRVVTYDLVGSGGSDCNAYDRRKYGTLQGYADDLIDIADEFADGPVILVGHSVSAMSGLLAAIKAPQRFAAQVMLAPSPFYINEGDYVGGFTRQDIEELLETMESNYLGWSSSMAPAIMGVPDQPELGQELATGFCRNDPAIATHFAKVTFLSDHREALPRSPTPALILQCTDDIIAPRHIGAFMQARMPHCVSALIENVGHCPHMSAAAATYDAIANFLRTLAVDRG